MISLIFMWNLKKWYKWIYLQNKQNLRHRKQTYHYQRGRVWVKVAQSCPTPCNPMDDTVHRILPGQNTGVGSLSLLKGNFPTQGSNPGHPHCRQILYQLSHKRSPGKSGEGWIRSLGLTDIHYYVTDTHYCTVSNDLLYSTRNYIQYCIITYNGKESEK